MAFLVGSIKEISFYGFVEVLAAISIFYESMVGNRNKVFFFSVQKLPTYLF